MVPCGAHPCEPRGSGAAGRICTGAKEKQPCSQPSLPHLVQPTEEVKQFAYPCSIVPLVAFWAKRPGSAGQGCSPGGLDVPLVREMRVGCAIRKPLALPAPLVLPCQGLSPLLLGDVCMAPEGKGMGHQLQLLQPQGLLVSSKKSSSFPSCF